MPVSPPLTPGALQGVHVLDMSDSSCVYGAKVLADLGADVVRIEPTGGDPMRRMAPLDSVTGESLFYRFMNTNKRSVALDLDRKADRARFAELVACADIVFESTPPGHLAELELDYRSFERANPKLVWTSVTPFGSEGPYSKWKANDLVSQAMGGFMTLTGLPEREPLKLHGEQTCYIAGLHAASATLLAYWHAVQAGEGQFVDVSVHECIAHTLESAIQVYTSEGGIRTRQPRASEAGVGLFPCKDGEIFIFATSGMIAASWRNLVAWLQEETIPGAEQLSDEKWTDLRYRRTEEAQSVARGIISEFTRTRSKQQLYAQLQQRNVLCAPMSGIGDLFDNTQLKFLHWFTEQPFDADRTICWPGPAFRLSETPRRDPVHMTAAAADTSAVFAAATARAG